MLLALLIFAADQAGGSTNVANVATLIGSIATLLVALTGLAALLLRRSKRKNGRVDPLDAVEEEIQSLRDALKTCRGNVRDLTSQLKACRADRDEFQARLTVAIGELGSRDQTIADLRKERRER